jgi:hypothetical protein
MVHDTILVDQETKSENDFQEKSRDAGLPEVILLTYPPRFPALVDRYTETPPVFHPVPPICPVINRLLPLKA